MSASQSHQLLRSRRHKCQIFDSSASWQLNVSNCSFCPSTRFTGRIWSWKGTRVISLHVLPPCLPAVRNARRPRESRPNPLKACFSRRSLPLDAIWYPLWTISWLGSYPLAINPGEQPPQTPRALPRDSPILRVHLHQKLMVEGPYFKWQAFDWKTYASV